MRLVIRWLLDGELPVFDLPPETKAWWMFDESRVWKPRFYGREAQVHSAFDLPLGTLAEKLPQWLEPVMPGDHTLVFHIRYACRLPLVRTEAANASTMITVQEGNATDISASRVLNISAVTGVANYIAISNLGGLSNTDTSLTQQPFDTSGIACAKMWLPTNSGDAMYVNGGMAVIPGYGGIEVLSLEEIQAAILEACTLGLQEPVNGSTHPAILDCRADYAYRKRSYKRWQEEAHKKALALLCRWLSPEQRAEMEAHGHFHVQGGDGHLYLVQNGFGHNVFRIEDGQRTVRYCLVSKDARIPVYDLMLIQKLLLELDPETFLKTANKSRIPVTQASGLISAAL